MSDVSIIQPGGLDRFKPDETKKNQAKIDAVVDFARKIQDWPMMEQAIDEKIADQDEFVRWWAEKVRRPGQGNNAERGYLSTEVAEAQTGVTQQLVSRWRKRLQDKGKYRDRLVDAAYRKAELRSANNHRAEGTGENEWFTPAKYVDAAREVMGGIDLDPATNPAAQEWIQAGQFFTRADDGLSKEWHGRVWLNPPYSQPEIFQFAEKLVAELSADRVEQAIMLTHNYTDTAWFHLAESIANRICFTRGRVKFVDIDGEQCAPTQGQAFFYYGSNVEAFVAAFTEFGFIR